MSVMMQCYSIEICPLDYSIGSRILLHLFSRAYFICKDNGRNNQNMNVTNNLTCSHQVLIGNDC